MKKIIGFLVFISLLLSIFPISIADININFFSLNHDLINTNKNSEWTWMFYDDADFYRAYDPLDDFANEAYSSMNLNVIVLQDTNDGPAKIWFIDENHNKNLLMDLDEVDMGEGRTLSNFINYSKENYPAERYLLSFYNHGSGWQGACVDDTDNGWLTMDEMQKSLTETGGVDVICFTAPCLMGSIESVYELKDCTDVYVGSEETSGYNIWRDAIGDICRYLNENPNSSNIDIGKNIISILQKNKIYDEMHLLLSLNSLMHVTMSAIRTDLLDELVEDVDRLAIGLIDKMNKETNTYLKIEILLKLSKSFGNILRFKNSDIIDLYDFSKKCRIIFSSDSSIKSKADDIIEVIDEIVIGNYRGIKQLRAHGLTIYFPSEFYNSNYGETLDFCNNTHWDELIISYINGKSEYNESNIDQFQTDSGSGAVVCGKWMWAQSFIPSTDTLDKVMIPMIRNGFIFSDVKISIRKDLTGEDLTSETKSFFQIPRGNYRWIEFDFDDISIDSGEVYFIVCFTAGGDNNLNLYSWMSSLKDVYNNGDAWIGWNKGNNWEIWENPPEDPSRFDFCFKTYSK